MPFTIRGPEVGFGEICPDAPNCADIQARHPRNCFWGIGLAKTSQSCCFEAGSDGGLQETWVK